MSKSTNSQVTTLDDAPKSAAAPDAPEQTAELKAVAAGNASSLSGEKKILTIHQTQGEGGSDAVSVGLNGYTYVIKRGVPVTVPVEVIEILENAVQRVYEGQTQGGATGRDVPRYAFSVK